MAKKFKAIDLTAGILAVVGAVHTGLLGVFNFNIATVLANALRMNWVATLIYSVIGLSGLWIAGRTLMGKYMKR